MVTWFGMVWYSRGICSLSLVVIRARSFVVNDLRLETKSSLLESSHYLRADMSSLQ